MTDFYLAAFIGSIDLEQTKEFLIRFGMNIVSLIILVRLLYYEYRKEGIPEYLFAFFLMGVAVFMICTVLDMVDLNLGIALGLFALFGILRFRTQSIPVREMTYLFLVIAVGGTGTLIICENANISISRSRDHIQHLEIEYASGEKEAYTYRPVAMGFHYEAAEVMRCLDMGLKESPVVPLSFSRDLIRTLDRIRKRAGIIYPPEVDL